MRGWLAKKKYQQRKQATITLQKHVRGYSIRKVTSPKPENNEGDEYLDASELEPEAGTASKTATLSKAATAGAKAKK